MELFAFIISLFVTPFPYVIIWMIYDHQKGKIHKQRSYRLSQQAALDTKKLCAEGFIIHAEHYREKKPSGDESEIIAEYIPEHNKYSLEVASSDDLYFAITIKKSKDGETQYFPEFDANINISCHNEEKLLTLLDRETRNLILTLIGKRVEKHDNSVFISNKQIWICTYPDDHDYSLTVELMKKIARAFKKSEAIDQLLLNHFNDECESFQVRALNLDLLMKKYPVYRDDQIILSKLHNKQNPWFRYIEYIYRLNGAVESPRKLQNLFQQSNLLLKFKILSYIKKKANPIYLDFILTTCNSFSNRIVLESLSILENIGSPRANDLLLLKINDKNLEIKKTAIKVLGRCGTMSAYSVLENYRTIRPSIRKLINNSLMEIQSRYDMQNPALKGALSLSADNNSLKGALSIEDK